LKKLCPNNNECFSLGKYTSLTNAYFDDMSFGLAVDPITYVSRGQNGMVQSIRHEKQGYIATSLLKMSLEQTSDNLLYEYLVGLFINKHIKSFPCFLQTFAAYKYKSDDLHNKATSLTSGGMTVAELASSIEPLYTYGQKITDELIERMLKTSCIDSHRICLSTQYFENARTLHSMFASPTKFFITTDLLQMLLQIYIPLGLMETSFTHNDLKADNVLVYTIPNNQYVTMHYDTPRGRVTLKTRYICKIIDYGRCYFKDAQMTSETVTQTLCKYSECAPNCGKQKGYTFFDDNLSSYNMSGTVNNPGKDLWLAQSIKGQLFMIPYTYAELAEIFRSSKWINIVNSVPYEQSNYGVNYPREKRELEDSPGKIISVSSFANKLIDFFLSDQASIDAYHRLEFEDTPNGPSIKYGTMIIDATKIGSEYTLEV